MVEYFYMFAINTHAMNQFSCKSIGEQNKSFKNANLPMLPQ